MHPKWWQQGWPAEVKLIIPILSPRHCQGCCPQDPARPGLCCRLYLLRERFLSSPPQWCLSRTLLCFYKCFIFGAQGPGQRAWDSLRSQSRRGHGSGTRAPSDGLFSFLGMLARQKKALAFPTGKRKKKNKGNFPLKVMGDPLEADLTPELHREKGGFMQPGGGISPGMLRSSLWDPPGTAVIVPFGSSRDCCDRPHLH